MCATLISKGLVGTIIPTLPTYDTTVTRKATGDPLLQEDKDRFKESLKGLTMSQKLLLQNTVVELVDKYFNSDSFIKESHPHCSKWSFPSRIWRPAPWTLYRICCPKWRKDYRHKKNSTTYWMIGSWDNRERSWPTRRQE